MNRFGPFGGRYVPETLIGALDELSSAYDEAASDQSFSSEVDCLLRDFGGRPTALYHAA